MSRPGRVGIDLDVPLPVLAPQKLLVFQLDARFADQGARVIPIIRQRLQLLLSDLSDVTQHMSSQRIARVLANRLHHH